MVVAQLNREAIPVARGRNWPRPRLAKGVKNWVALEKEGKAIRVGYLNFDGSVGRAVLLEQTTAEQDEFLLEWFLNQVDMDFLLKKVVEKAGYGNRPGIEVVDDVLDRLFGEPEEVKGNVTSP